MQGRSLFEKIRGYWPDTVILSKELGKTEDEPIWCVVRLHDSVEEAIADDWERLAAWSFHQAIHERAREAIAAGCSYIERSSVSYETFDKFMRQNLSDESWSHFETTYEG